MDTDIVTPGGTRLDLAFVHQTEARVAEIAIVTPTKAPELMSVFSRACFQLGRLLREVHLGHEKAKKELANRKAVMIIDVIPGKMADKGLKPNDDTRQAFLELDGQYSHLQDCLIEWEAVLIYLQRKIKDMEAALNAVKSAIRDTSEVWRRPNYNTYAAGGVDEFLPEPATQPSTSIPTTTTKTGFKVGKARY